MNGFANSLYKIKPENKNQYLALFLKCGSIFYIIKDPHKIKYLITI